MNRDVVIFVGILCLLSFGFSGWLWLCLFGVVMVVIGHLVMEG